MNPLAALHLLLNRKKPAPAQKAGRSSAPINLSKLVPNLGTSDGGNPQAAIPPQLQGQVRPLDTLPQGGQFNPGVIPLQGSNIRYRQGPQPTNPWYDF